MHHEPYEVGPRHHLFYPKRWYQTDLEKRFRELPCCIVPLAPFVHALQHSCLDNAPPQKPSVDCMVQAIENYLSDQCGCTHHLPPNVHNLTDYRERRERVAANRV